MEHSLYSMPQGTISSVLGNANNTNEPHYLDFWGSVRNRAAHDEIPLYYWKQQHRDIALLLAPSPLTTNLPTSHSRLSAFSSVRESWSTSNSIRPPQTQSVTSTHNTSSDTVGSVDQFRRGDVALIRKTQGNGSSQTPGWRHGGLTLVRYQFKLLLFLSLQAIVLVQCFYYPADEPANDGQGWKHNLLVAGGYGDFVIWSVVAAEENDTEWTRYICHVEQLTLLTLHMIHC